MFYYIICTAFTSVVDVDPNILNLGPFWIRIKGYQYVINFEEKKKKKNCKEYRFTLIKYRYRYIFLSVESVNGCTFILTPFSFELSCIYQSGSGSVFGIRIHKGPENGSNLDPDPQLLYSLFTVRSAAHHTAPWKVPGRDSNLGCAIQRQGH